MKKYSIEIKFAFIFSIASILWFALEKMLGWHEKTMQYYLLFSSAFAIVAILTYVIALKTRKRSLGNIISWRQTVVYGLVLSSVIALLSPIVQFISLKIISPDFLQNSIDTAVAKGMQPDLAQTFYGFKSVAIQAFGFALSMGILMSAVIGLFIKNKPST